VDASVTVAPSVIDTLNRPGELDAAIPTAVMRCVVLAVAETKLASLPVGGTSVTYTTVDGPATFTVALVTPSTYWELNPTAPTARATLRTAMSTTATAAPD
jgi:hypothetical protein